jgi:SAM-dependent methyltransferase
MKPIEYNIMARREDDHWWYRGLRALVVGHLTRVHTRGGRRSIVDVGCGTGGCYRAVRTRFPDAAYVGIDLEPRALSHCCQRGLWELIRAAAHQLPVRRESADVVICLDVLCYASVCPRTALQQVYEALRPGGLLILNLPAFACLRGQHDVAVGIHRRFRAAEVRALLAHTGFALVTCPYWTMVLFFPLLAWRWLSRSDSGREPRSDVARLPGWLNAVCSALLGLEVSLTRWIALPLGSSVFLLAQKPKHSAGG